MEKEEIEQITNRLFEVVRGYKHGDSYDFDGLLESCPNIDDSSLSMDDYDAVAEALNQRIKDSGEFFIDDSIELASGGYFLEPVLMAYSKVPQEFKSVRAKKVKTVEFDDVTYREAGGDVKEKSLTRTYKDETYTWVLIIIQPQSWLYERYDSEELQYRVIQGQVACSHSFYKTKETKRRTYKQSCQEKGILKVGDVLKISSDGYSDSYGGYQSVSFKNESDAPVLILRTRANVF